MSYIDLPQGLPGIRALMTYRPEAAEPLNRLADVLLRGSDTLSAGERELIATFVSAANDCTYCHSVHGAVAAAHFGNDELLVAQVKSDPEAAAISPKLKALLRIAGKVQTSGRNVSASDVGHARECGATDLDIHDTVLIAAFFSLCNRYVDGLGTWAPADPDFYRERGAVLAREGYVSATRSLYQK